jgi:hypothetical protein
MKLRLQYHDPEPQYELDKAIEKANEKDAAALEELFNRIAGVDGEDAEDIFITLDTETMKVTLKLRNK